MVSNRTSRCLLLLVVVVLVVDLGIGNNWVDCKKSRTSTKRPSKNPSSGAGKHFQKIGNKIKGDLKSVDVAYKAFEKADPNDISAYGGKLNNLVSTFVPSIGFLGPAFALFTNILGDGRRARSDTEIVMAVIKHVSTEVTGISDHMHETRDPIEEAFISQSFTEQQRKLSYVNEYYNRYAEDPNEITEAAITTACKTDDPYKSISWLKSAFSEAGTGELLNIYNKTCDRNFLSESTKIVMKTFMQASYLWTMCFGFKTKGIDEEVVNSTSAADVIRLANELNNLVNITTTTNDFLLTKLVTCVVSDIEAYATDNPSVNDSQFVGAVYDLLKGRYSWRDWLVVSYSMEIDGFDQHTTAGNGLNIVSIREHGRTFWISSPDIIKGPDYREDLRKVTRLVKTESRLEPCKRICQSNCTQVVNFLREELDKYDVSLIGCVQTDNYSPQFKYEPNDDKRIMDFKEDPTINDRRKGKRKHNHNILSTKIPSRSNATRQEEQQTHPFSVFVVA